MLQRLQLVFRQTIIQYPMGTLSTKDLPELSDMRKGKGALVIRGGTFSSRMPASRLVKHETLSKSSKAVSHSKAKPSRQNQRTRDHIVATDPQVWTPHAEAACFEAKKN